MITRDVGEAVCFGLPLIIMARPDQRYEASFGYSGKGERLSVGG
jgi:hypothetical protein